MPPAGIRSPLHKAASDRRRDAGAATIMNVWADIILSGLAVGALYVLVGHGFNIVYLATHTFNFAQGQFVAASGLLAYAVVSNQMSLGWIAAIIVFIMIVGVIEEKIALTPILKRPGSEVWVVSTLGVSIAIQGALMVFFGNDPFQVALPYTNDIVAFAGTRQTVGAYVVMVSALVFTLVLVLVLRFSWIGRALRAVAEDPRAARGLGINTSAIITASFAISAGLGAAAGILAAPMTYARSDLGSLILVQVFIVLAIGGFGSTLGLLVIGISLGIFESVVKSLGGGSYVSLLEFAMLVIALMVRPRGLFASKAPRTV